MGQRALSLLGHENLKRIRFHALNLHVGAVDGNCRHAKEFVNTSSPTELGVNCQIRFLLLFLIFASCVFLPAIFISISAQAQEMPKEGINKCSVCHAINETGIGPAWQDVSAKYKGKTEAEKTLVLHISKGGEFGWGLGEMPAKGLGASDTEIQSLTRFILGLK